jgi:hypothetical protein
MLTEIEWWGGLIFLWWAGSYWFVIQATKGVYNLDAIMSHVSYILSAVVLAFYFYPLENALVKQLYIGSIVTGLIALTMVLFLPGSDESDTDEQNSTSETEDDKDYTMLGNLLFTAPLVTIFILGAFKSYTLI